MNQNRISSRSAVAATICLYAVAAPFQLSAKQRPQEAGQDRIGVIAHLTLDGMAQRKILRSEHWRRQYLYMQSVDGRELTIVDITAPASPSIVQRISTEAQEANLSDVVGTAALVTDVQPEPASLALRTVSVMSFAEPNHPRVVRQFKGVTDMLSDRGLIYLVNGDGLWILKEQPAADKQLDEEYANYVLYNR